MTIVLLDVARMACAEEQVVEEYQVKGAFLLNFTKFVEWPVEAFKGPGDPIAICVLGMNPFGPGLDRAAQGIVAANRRVSVRQISDGQQARECQIVFVSAQERRCWRPLLEALRGRSVLTVGEWDGFLAAGGVVDFKLEAEKVRMEISSEAADRARLHISAKLLSLAQSGRR